MTTRTSRAASAALGSALLLATAGHAWAEEPSTQVSPSATQPLPAEGPGQTAVGAAVTGSAPDPAGASTTDNSQEQQGTLLKPGPKAGDMDAAAGAGKQPSQ
jgi:hypothetical protein